MSSKPKRVIKRPRGRKVSPSSQQRGGDARSHASIFPPSTVSSTSTTDDGAPTTVNNPTADESANHPETVPDIRHDCSDTERLDQERVLLEARIASFDVPMNADPDTTKAKYIPWEYTTPAKGHVQCLHCGASIEGIPVPMVFHMDATRITPIYKIGRFFCDGACSLGHIVECHNAEPHIYAYTKQLLKEVFQIDSASLLPAPPRFTLQSFQRNPGHGIQWNTFRGLKQCATASEPVQPILQNGEDGFRVYTQATDDALLASSTPGRQGQGQGQGKQEEETLRTQRPTERSTPLDIPTADSNIPPVLAEAYDRVHGSSKVTGSLSSSRSSL